MLYLEYEGGGGQLVNNAKERSAVTKSKRNLLTFLASSFLNNGAEITAGDVWGFRLSDHLILLQKLVERCSA